VDEIPDAVVRLVPIGSLDATKARTGAYITHDWSQRPKLVSLFTRLGIVTPFAQVITISSHAANLAAYNIIAPPTRLIRDYSLGMPPIRCRNRYVQVWKAFRRPDYYSIWFQHL